MTIFTKAFTAARTALVYITVGALTDIWSGIWYVYLLKHPPAADYVWYWCYGLFFSGLTLLIIGLGVGRIGRSARHADLPAADGTETVAQPGQRVVVSPSPASGPVVAAMAPRGQDNRR